MNRTELVSRHAVTFEGMFLFATGRFTDRCLHSTVFSTLKFYHNGARLYPVGNEAVFLAVTAVTTSRYEAVLKYVQIYCI